MGIMTELFSRPVYSADGTRTGDVSIEDEYAQQHEQQTAPPEHEYNTMGRTGRTARTRRSPGMAGYSDYVTDSGGREHEDSGPAGGQFTAGGSDRTEDSMAAERAAVVESMNEMRRAHDAEMSVWREKLSRRYTAMADAMERKSDEVHAVLERKMASGASSDDPSIVDAWRQLEQNLRMITDYRQLAAGKQFNTQYRQGQYSDYVTDSGGREHEDSGRPTGGQFTTKAGGAIAPPPTGQRPDAPQRPTGTQPQPAAPAHRQVPPDFTLPRQPNLPDVYRPDPTIPNPATGLVDRSRVGVPGGMVPPPPNKIPRLPNLSNGQRKVESRFADAYLKDPDGMALKYITALSRRIVGDAPNVFATDDVKSLSPDWNPGSFVANDVQRKAAMAKYNTAVHQTANAVAKRAFLAYLDRLPPDKKTVLVTNGGCHAADTPILMFDGSVRKVQDVMTGDVLMGADSQPRTVQCLVRGRDRMYRVTPKRGTPFVVNEQHILSIKTRRGPGSAKRTKWVTLNLKVSEVLARGESFRRNSWLYRTGVEFESVPVPLDPYFLGLWLGDGTHSEAAVTSADKEIDAYLRGFVTGYSRLKLMVARKPNNQASTYRLALKTRKGPRHNPVIQSLRRVGVFKDKHIPPQYIINDRKTRLALLAGLLDSDGHLNQKEGNAGFEITTNREQMAYEIEFLVRSLGFAAYVKKVSKTASTTGYTGTYYQMHIAGDVSEIPTRVVRKQAKPRIEFRSNDHPTKDVLKTGYTIERVEDGEFYGFQIDGDHLYLMGDFTVTHNCAAGKGTAVHGSTDPNSPFYGVVPAPQLVGAIWDAAGEQNATENQWVLDECRKRGIKATFLYVHADPRGTWENPERGVITRAVKKGRMVDARLFADSYALGAKNMADFHAKNANDPNASFIFVDNSDKGNPRVIDGVPPESLTWDAEQIYAAAVAGIVKRAPGLPESIIKGGLNGLTIWGPPRLPKRKTGPAGTVGRRA